MNLTRGLTMGIVAPLPPMQKALADSHILTYSSIRFHLWDMPMEDSELDSLRFLSSELGITTAPCFGVLYIDLPVDVAQAIGDPLISLKSLVDRYSERRQWVHAIRLSVDGNGYFTVFIPATPLLPRHCLEG